MKKKETVSLIWKRFDEFENFYACRIMLNVIRYGGYNVGALNYEEGGYLHEVPTISQFVSGIVPIVVPSDSNKVTVSLFDTVKKQF